MVLQKRETIHVIKERKTKRKEMNEKEKLLNKSPKKLGFKATRGVNNTMIYKY